MLLDKVCKHIGVKLGEVWYGEWTTSENKYKHYIKFKITETQMLGYRKDYKSWFSADSFLPDVVYGRLRPMSEPKEGGTYYISRPSLPTMHSSIIWNNDTTDQLWLERGLVFKTKDEAIVVAEQMLKTLKEV